MANAVSDFLDTFKTGANAASVIAPIVPKVEAKLDTWEAEARAAGEEIKEGAVIYGVSTLTLQFISTCAVTSLAVVAVLNYNRARRGN